MSFWMTESRLRILSISIADQCGGAEKMAVDLHGAYGLSGHESWLAVAVKHSDDHRIVLIPKSKPGIWARAWRGVYHRVQAVNDRWPAWGANRLLPLISNTMHPGKWYDRVMGYDDFRFPETYRLLDLVPERPDVIHCHNLHSYYFDLHALGWLSKQAPVVVSLHDSWLLTGLCGHTFDCDRWRTGCGHCPYLSTWQEPAWSVRDGTAANWRRKKRIYARSRLYVTTACHWLMDKVRQSILAPGVVGQRVIPYGVDTEVFQPGDQSEARSRLGLPREALIGLFVARGLASNPSKDYRTLREAIQALAERNPSQHMVFIAKGESMPVDRIGKTEIRFVPWNEDARVDIASYYQAADVYVHAANMDTFPLSVLEAQACGLAVVASAVGGIPEQVVPLDSRESNPKNGPTGMLVPAKDVRSLAFSLEQVLLDGDLRRRLGGNALARARQHFDLRRQVADYLNWYREIRENLSPDARSGYRMDQRKERAAAACGVP
jgi:glycosyltransferase involved in cell wall biosynthesis